MNEALKVLKLRLPTKSKRWNHLDWNDEKKSHEMFERIKTRTSLTRKDIVEKIVQALDEIDFASDGLYIINFKKSNFKLVVFVKTKEATVQIKTVLSSSMLTRPSDKVLSINEAESIYDIDLKEFYENGFVNGCYGSLLIEETVDRSQLEVFSNYEITVEL